MPRPTERARERRTGKNRIGPAFVERQRDPEEVGSEESSGEEVHARVQLRPDRRRGEHGRDDDVRPWAAGGGLHKRKYQPPSVSGMTVTKAYGVSSDCTALSPPLCAEQHQRSEERPDDAVEQATAEGVRVRPWPSDRGVREKSLHENEERCRA